MPPSCRASPTESALLAQITPKDGKADMPKDGPPLTEAELALIRKLDRARREERHTRLEPAALRCRASARLSRGARAEGSVEVFAPRRSCSPSPVITKCCCTKPDGSGVIDSAGWPIGADRIRRLLAPTALNWLAVAGGSPGRFGEVQVWDMCQKRTMKLLQDRSAYDTIYGASWSPDGKVVGVGCPDNTVRAFDAETGEQKLFSGAHNDWVLDTVFSVQSDHVISVGRDMTMKLVEVATQRFIDNLTSITPGALKGGLICLDRHPTKDELLCGGSDGVPKVFKMIRTQARKIGDDAQLVRAFDPLPGRVFGVAYSNDGNRIACASSSDGKGEIRVYDANDGKQIWRTEVPEGGMYTVDFSPDGKTLAAGGFDGDVRLLSAADGKLLKRFTPVTVEVPAVAGK
jgi:WD40 repeat protein